MLDNTIKCFESELIGTRNMTVRELFQGFNSIRVITFSYEVSFMNELLEMFDHAEVIFGANFLVQKDMKIQELLAEVLTNAYETAKVVMKHQRMVDLLETDRLELRTSTFVLDHRKVYLLHADDGRTRVITASANMSGRAWNNDQIEHYQYDDTSSCYEEFERDFNVAWDLAEELPMSVLVSKREDDLVEANNILKKIKETGRTLVVQQGNEISIDLIRYTIDHEKVKERYQTVLSKLNPKAKDGMFELNPQTVEKIKKEIKKTKIKASVNNKTEHYPFMRYDLENGECWLNDEPLDLHPSKEEICHDIEIITRMYKNFDDFVGNADIIRNTHYRLMNAIFASPFTARLRCSCQVSNISASSLPLFALISSETANSGKTFMIQAALKMMTGKDLVPVRATNCRIDDVRTIRGGCQNMPFFIDEIDNSYISKLKSIIKNPEECEQNMMEEMPMLIFASNDVLKPEEAIRKRMIFFTLNGALPSTIDKIAFESRGKKLLKALGTGFYREYLRRMLVAVEEEMVRMLHPEELPAEYYPDLMKMSSEVIVSVFDEYTEKCPDFIRALNWRDDYSSDTNSMDAVNEIWETLREHPELCRIEKKTVTITFGIDKDSKQKITSWKNVLPAELKIDPQLTRDYNRIVIDREGLEKLLGFRIRNTGFLSRIRR